MSQLHDDEGSMELPCPQCGEFSDSIKSSNFFVLAMLFVVYMWWTFPTMGCPRCYRLQALKYLAINLLAMNLLWPFLAVPLFLVYLVKSFVPGHTPDAEMQLWAHRTRAFQAAPRLPIHSLEEFRAGRTNAPLPPPPPPTDIRPG